MNFPTLFSYLPPEDAAMLCKLAASEPAPHEPAPAPQKEPEAGKPEPAPHPLKTMLGHGLSLAGGWAGGRLAGAAADKLYGLAKGDPNLEIPVPYLHTILPIVGSGLGLAYNMSEAKKMEMFRRAAEGTDNKP